ncbi:hypothetical protein U27_06459 [Candidatus Vecturithrix granuli]|uniref:Uncharacterized protein n=1 Tax=Vecturithrix granuli TaxID=1499967 RepID=A0A081C4G9_VECG1|nr:hypothetical protein U27_06459 [Candidatus Vecturithrix granuli]
MRISSSLKVKNSRTLQGIKLLFSGVSAFTTETLGL